MIKAVKTLIYHQAASSLKIVQQSYQQQLMLAQLNRFRQNPTILKKQLEERLNYINQNKLLFSPKHPYKSIKTKEGLIPIKEILEEININRQLSQLSQNEFLNECASFIADSYSRVNIDQQTFLQNIAKEIRSRIDSNRQYQVNKEIKCIIGVGFKDEGEPLLSILIDDGDTARQKRKILMENTYEYYGFGCSPLIDNSLVCGVYLLANLNKQIP